MRTILHNFAVLALVVSLSACQNISGKDVDNDIGWIGVATIDSEGTITLRLRSQESEGPIAHGLFEYPVDHEKYSDIKSHVGELAVGEWKNIPPFPDK